MDIAMYNSNYLSKIDDDEKELFNKDDLFVL